MNLQSKVPEDLLDKLEEAGFPLKYKVRAWNRKDYTLPTFAEVIDYLQSQYYYFKLISDSYGDYVFLDETGDDAMDLLTGTIEAIKYLINEKSMDI